MASPPPFSAGDAKVGGDGFEALFAIPAVDAKRQGEVERLAVKQLGGAVGGSPDHDLGRSAAGLDEELQVPLVEPDDGVLPDPGGGDEEERRFVAGAVRFEDLEAAGGLEAEVLDRQDGVRAQLLGAWHGDSA
jgi:hypothetical protein